MESDQSINSRATVKGDCAVNGILLDLLSIKRIGEKKNQCLSATRRFTNKYFYLFSVLREMAINECPINLAHHEEQQF
jgi:hypothetical protein